MEFAILNAVQGMRNPFLDWLMPLVSSLGNGGILWILAAAILLCMKRTRRWGVAMAAALILGFVTGNVILKPLVGRARPFEVVKGIELLIAAPKDFSFPSGHTLSSFAAASALFCRNRKWGAAALGMALLIAFSRLYLYVHYPTDVLGGMVLGVLAGILGYRISKRQKQ